MRHTISRTLAFGSILLATSTAWAYETEVYAVGDIAQSGYEANAQATASLITGSYSRIVVLGDANNLNGTLDEYWTYYDPYWGPLWNWTWPVPGNHDYFVPNAQGYKDYMGFAGWPTTYYDYYEGSWHFIALDSHCAGDPNCRDGQLQWLQSVAFEDDAHQCTLAYFHHPRFSSGPHGNNEGQDEDHPDMRPIWEALYWGGADLVLSGHDHGYERFEPMGIDGEYAASGMYQFVVGTGGARLRSAVYPYKDNSAERIKKNGVLWLGLNSTTFDFAFKQTDGDVGDSGSTVWCYY